MKQLFKTMDLCGPNNGRRIVAERVSDATTLELINEGFMGNEKWFEIITAESGEVISVKCNGIKIPTDTEFTKFRIQKILG